MHSMFGAVRLYVETVHLRDGDPAPAEDGPLPPGREGAWAIWAQEGQSRDPVVPSLPLLRVIGTVHLRTARRLRP
jgi:hypothetical protein